MIIRTDDEFLKREHMTVSDGFVITENYDDFAFKNPLFEGSFWSPFFGVFKVNKRYPLVIHNNGSSVQVYPKRDFNAINSKKGKSRFPSEWSKDRTAYDLVAFILVPYNINEQDTGLKKLDYLEGEKNFFGGSLLYVERGMTLDRDNKRAAHVMPSTIPNYFYSWMTKGHRISSYEGTKHEFINEGMIKIPDETAGNLTRRVEGLLAERFETKFFLNR